MYASSAIGNKPRQIADACSVAIIGIARVRLLFRLLIWTSYTCGSDSGIVPVLQRGLSTQRTVMPATRCVSRRRLSRSDETIPVIGRADHVAIHRRLRERMRAVVIGDHTGAIAGL